MTDEPSGRRDSNIVAPIGGLAAAGGFVGFMVAGRLPPSLVGPIGAGAVLLAGIVAGAALGLWLTRRGKRTPP